MLLCGSPNELLENVLINQKKALSGNLSTYTKARYSSSEDILTENLIMALPRIFRVPFSRRFITQAFPGHRFIFRADSSIFPG